MEFQSQSEVVTPFSGRVVEVQEVSRGDTAGVPWTRGDFVGSDDSAFLGFTLDIHFFLWSVDENFFFHHDNLGVTMTFLGRI